MAEMHIQIRLSGRQAETVDYLRLLIGLQQEMISNPRFVELRQNHRIIIGIAGYDLPFVNTIVDSTNTVNGITFSGQYVDLMEMIEKMGLRED